MSHRRQKSFWTLWHFAPKLATSLDAKAPQSTTMMKNPDTHRQVSLRHNKSITSQYFFRRNKMEPIKLKKLKVAKESFFSPFKKTIGTPEYLAPEVLGKKNSNEKCDIWSIGILTYEMLAGIDPFNDDDPMAIYQKILKGRTTWVGSNQRILSRRGHWKVFSTVRGDF